MTTSLLSLSQLSARSICRMVALAYCYKGFYRHNQLPRALTLWDHRVPQGTTLALLFQKRSTRTRLASETAMALLGGQSIFLGSADIQLGVNESLRDTATVLGRMVDVIMMRCGDHAELEEMERHAKVPVLNALSDTFHPTQILADLLTMFEHASLPNRDPQMTARMVTRQQVDETLTSDRSTAIVDQIQDQIQETLAGQTVCWIGDGNNILNSLLLTLPRLGMHVQVATPADYRTPASIWQQAQTQAQRNQCRLEWTEDPRHSLQGANFVLTDTWVSMGQEEEKQKRLRDFAGFRIDAALMVGGQPHPQWRFLHCLPRKQEEVSDEIFYDNKRSLVFDEAENRKWTIMSSLARALYRLDRA